jgi:hypothetical protein
LSIPVFAVALLSGTIMVEQNCVCTASEGKMPLGW